MWTGFVVFWNVQVWRDHASLFLRLWGLPFLLVGLFILIGPFLLQPYWRATTRYALTDRRVLIVRRGWSAQSLDRARLPWLKLEQHRDGTGTIWFERDPAAISSMGTRRRGWAAAFDRTMRFERIADAALVYDLLTAPGGRSPPSPAAQSVRP